MIFWLKKHAIQLGLALTLLITLLGHTLGYWQITPLLPLERQLYDFRLASTVKGGHDNRIVIVDIDEKSLAALGRWPWGRDVMARLMDQLFDHYHSSVVGFDVVFAEPDTSSGMGVLDRLAQGPLKNNPEFLNARSQLAPQLDFDAQFAKSLKNRSVVLGYYFSGDKSLASGLLPTPEFAKKDLAGIFFHPLSGVGYGSNLPVLMNSAASAGHFNPGIDEDGVVRTVPMLMEYKGNYYAPLSLELARLYLSKELGIPLKVEAQLPEEFAGKHFDNLVGLQLGPMHIPVDDHGRAIISYRGGEGSFPYVSAVDVLNGKVPAEVLKNRMILVGTTAPGLKDHRVTPVGSVYPGVEIHANVAASILDQAIPSNPDYMPGVEMLVLLLTAAVTLVFLLRFSPLIALLGSGAWLGLVLWFNFHLWRVNQIEMHLAPVLTLSVLLYLLITVYGYFFETRHKRKLSSLFSRYVPPELVTKMSDDPEAYTMDGQSRELTVLFSDVRGFTSLSESMDPKELTRLMNEFLTALSKVIRVDYLGTIDKYMGDCVMAFWGAPFNDPEHPRHAVHAALAMHQAMRDLAPRLKEHGWPIIQIGVGVNTGRVTVGDMGSQYRKAYTVMGDAVNLASRLEGLTRYYGVDILVGETTAQQVDDIVFREVDMVRVKGKQEPVRIFEPLGKKGEVDQSTLDADNLFQHALKLYREQDWDRAELQLLNVQKIAPHALYDLYMKRISQWRANPPDEDWDGVYSFDSK